MSEIIDLLSKLFFTFVHLITSSLIKSKGGGGIQQESTMGYRMCPDHNVTFSVYVSILITAEVNDLDIFITGENQTFHDWFCMRFASRCGLPKFLIIKHQPSVYGGRSTHEV